MKKVLAVGLSGIVVAVLLAGCGDASVNTSKENSSVAATTVTEEVAEVFGPHKDLNQEPVLLKVERVGEHEVNVEMTAQITDIEIAKGKMYKAWTFNGEAPGPLVVVNQGDTINFKLVNIDPAIPHSIDLHAVHTAPSKNFADIMPNEDGTFTYPANFPGVFIYHCGTDPILSHIANGMHGVIIVKPTDGYPTNNLVDREFVLIQNEWYKYNDHDAFLNSEPEHVVLSTKALNEGERNTNEDTFSLKDEPLEAKVGERIRLYINNMGPNEVSSFHVVGSIMEDVYVDGNPANVLKGMQTIMLPASGGAVVEFVVTEEGNYPILTHQFKHTDKGAIAILKVTAE
jgi:nitrite reductase (NO-forming)